MSNSSLFQRVLVVEDEALLRWSIVETVERDGHYVTTADSSHAALAAMNAANKPFDVVLVSHPLPDSADFAVLAHCQRAVPLTAVVCMPVYDDREEITRARKLGACGILKKPFDLNALHRAVFDAAGV